MKNHFKNRQEKGITLVALVVTLIIMLILAGISLSELIGGKGLFQRTEDASNIYNEKKAREVLETVLLTDGQFEKNTNPKYNQDDFLDELIKKEIPGSDVRGDVAIIGEYAYELDRSVPKIGTRGNNGYLGNSKDLIFPVVTVAEITQADPEDNYRTAKIEITAIIDEKAENGIDRIEIWQNGVKLDTIDGKNEKNITTEYKANKNGVYIIKAYAKISNAETSGSARTTVEGIVPTVEFSPNGNKEWKKEHSTKIIVKETEEAKVISMKYLWKESSEAEPKAADFIEQCSNNSTITGKGENMTGKYRLWVLVTLGVEANKKTYVNGSKEFYFDNEGPNITEFKAEKYSIDGITIVVTAQDNKSGITKAEFYIDGELEDNATEIYEIPIESKTKSINITGLSTNEHNCKVILYDGNGNISMESTIGSTMMYVWDTYSVNWKHTYTLSEPEISRENVDLRFRADGYLHYLNSYNLGTDSRDIR